MRGPAATLLRSQAHQRGLTLVELTVAIVISSMIVGMIAMVVSVPVDRYVEQSRRNELVDASDRITHTLGNDFRKALPNSVRIGNFADTDVLQLLEARDVAFYEGETTPGTPPEGLSFAMDGDTFDVSGQFSISPTWLVVNNEGLPGRDAYEGGNVITWNTVPLAPWGQSSITLDPGFHFTNNPATSTNRVFAVRGPITYICNRTDGTLRRFDNHQIAANVPVNDADAQINVVGSTVATGVTACRFTCNTYTGTATCRQLATIVMTLTRGSGAEAENIQLLQQFPVENTP